MNKSRYFPFERNRYFYGKLLTVRDFESEQTYFNDKRRLLNRLLHGSGVVSGLQVIPVDEKSVSVEAGVALDSLGREIVVSSPVTLKLSMVEGFSNNEYAKNVYLCLAYDEKGKEPVHSVANSTIRSDEVSEYNRVLETYKIFIKEEAPDPSSFEYAVLFEDIQLLYEDEQVRVLLTTPRYVNPDEVFEATLTVEKTLQTERVSFEFELETDAFLPVQGVDEGKVRFVEPGDGQETEYETKFLLRAKEEPAEKAKIAMKPGTARLHVGDREIAVESPSVNKTSIIREAVNEQLLNDYYQRSLDQALAANPDQCIYLAKISLLQMGPTYVIDQVEQVPFGEYVYNPSLLYRLSRLDRKSSSSHFSVKTSAEWLDPESRPKLWADYHKDQDQFEFRLGLPRPKKMADDVATGVIELAFEEGQKSGVAFFSRTERRVVSEEIEHGFGPGDVLIAAGIEERDENDKVSDILNMADRTYIGDEEVFKGTEFESGAPHVTIGTLLYPKRGTFRIGAKLTGRKEIDKVRVRWWAVNRELPEEQKDQLAGKEAAAGAESGGGDTPRNGE